MKAFHYESYPFRFNEMFYFRSVGSLFKSRCELRGDTTPYRYVNVILGNNNKSAEISIPGKLILVVAQIILRTECR